MNNDLDVDTVTEMILSWIRNDRKAEEMHEITLSATTGLLSEGVFDSMKVLQFVSWLESTFSIEVGVNEMTPAVFATPGTVAIRVQELMSHRRVV